MKDFIITFLKVYGIGLITMIVLLLSLAYDNVNKIDSMYIAVVLIGTMTSTAFLVYLSQREDKNE